MERLYALLALDAAPTRALTVGALVAARLAPLTLLAPPFAVRGVSPLARTTILLALVLGLLPTALAAAPALPADTLSLTLLALRELALGGLFAVVVSIPFFGAEHAGRIVDGMRGGGQAELTLPSGERASLLASGLHLFALALYAASGGPRVLIRALAEGLERSPPGLATPEGGWPLALEGAAHLVVLVLPLALAIAAPAFVALVAADLGLAVVSRTAPQLPVYFAAMPLRAWLGVLAVLFALGWIAPELLRAFAAFFARA